jgi:hypothetical protein
MFSSVNGVGRSLTERTETDAASSVGGGVGGSPVTRSRHLNL